MADEKKPKIDLKARLGKQGAGAGTPPPPVAGGGMPMPAPTAAPAGLGGTAVMGNSGGHAPAQVPVPVPAPAPPIQKIAGGLPVPPGIPVGPPPAFKSPAGLALDPSNPLHAAYAQPAPAAPARAQAPPQPQRIEVDELTVQEARKGARKQGLVAGLVFGLVIGAIGYIAGGAQETSKGRTASVTHAKSLAVDVGKSAQQLKTLADKLEAGRNTLGKDKKFPDALIKELGSINVDFDGTKLAGVRFSGFNTDTTTGLIEYISGVQAMNDRKTALQNLLTRLQKPMTEQLNDAAANKPPKVGFVVLINKDSAKNPFGVLAPLQKPIELSAAMPAEFTATDPLSHSNVTAPKFKSLDNPGAAYMVPKSIEAACPSETAGQLGQLVSQLSRVINDIRGEGNLGAAGAPPGETALVEPKPGLLERADRLVTNLNKVQ